MDPWDFESVPCIENDTGYSSRCTMDSLLAVLQKSLDPHQ
jgi:hypothetical protein